MLKRITAILLTLMMIGSLTACGSEKQGKTSETPSQTENTESTEMDNTEAEPAGPTVDQTLETYYFKATMTVPAAGTDDGNLTPEYKEEEETQGGSALCGIANDTVAIELTYQGYTFNTNSYYVEKYGEKDPNFENYVEYMLDSDLQNAFTTGIEETKVGDYEALKYIYNGVNYVLNVDGLQGQFLVTVIPLNEDADLEELAADPDINSIKVEALNN